MINLYDLKQSLVRVYRDYQYSLVVIITMASTLAIALFLFSMVYTIQYKSLPAYQPSDIAWATRNENAYTFPVGGLTDYEYDFISQHQTTLDNFGRLERRWITLSNSQFAEQFNGAATSSQMFRLLGVDAFMGRTLLPTDDIEGAEKTLVIGYDIWKNTYNSSASVIGETVKVNGELATIVGVMPKGFRFPTSHDAWFSVTIPAGALPERGGWNSIFGRLKPGVTMAVVDREFKKLAGEMRKDYPNQYEGKDIEVIQFTDRFTDDFLVTLLAIASVAILLMGCVSVSNMIIVRNLENAKEVLIKSALGLPLLRVVMSLLLETFWLCSIATAIGLWLTALTLHYLGENLLDGPYWWVLEFELPIFLTGLAAAAFIWLATGVIPVWMALRRPTNSLLASGRKGGAGTALSRVMSGFASLQIFSAFILMVFTSLLMGGLIRMVNADYGIPRESYLTAEVKLSGIGYEELEQRVQYYDRLVEQASNIPGVESVAVTSGLPGGWSGNQCSFTSTERRIEINGSSPKCSETPINESYFSTMEIELLEGRNFTEADKPGAQEVAILNQSMADTLFPGVSAVGRQFQYDPENTRLLLTVVGVAPDVVMGNPLWYLSPASKDWRAQLYRPLRQKQPDWDGNALVIKTTGNPYAMVDKLKTIARTIDSEIPLSQVMSFDDFLKENESGFRRMIYIFMPAAILALLVSALGIYGITRRVVIQNTPDIGIMKSLGITETFINRKYFIAAGVQLAVSALAGLAFSLFVLPSMPENILTTDKNAIITASLIVAAIIGIVVLFASYIPLIAAHKLSPRDAMNYLNVAID
jgi:predicted permease